MTDERAFNPARRSMTDAHKQERAFVRAMQSVMDTYENAPSDFMEGLTIEQGATVLLQVAKETIENAE